MCWLVGWFLALKPEPFCTLRVLHPSSLTVQRSLLSRFVWGSRARCLKAVVVSCCTRNLSVAHTVALWHGSQCSCWHHPNCMPYGSPAQRAACCIPFCALSVHACCRPTELQLGKFTVKLNHRRLLDAMLAIAGVPAQKFRPICR